MKIACFLLACALTACAADTIEVFGYKWRVPVAADWKVVKEGGVEKLQLLVFRPSTQPRRPMQYALAETPDYVRVTLEVEVKREPESPRQMHPSLILVYAWRDADHFNYAHLSVDAASDAANHNGIFHVPGGDRVRISGTEGPATLGGADWQKVRLVYDGRSGRAEVFVDGKTSPSMRAAQTKPGAGRIGIGSFFDLGEFRNLRISGETVQ